MSSSANTDTELVVFAANHSPRLEYVLNWIFTERLNISYRLTHNEDETDSLPFFISYGRTFDNSFSIPDAYLLWEKDVIPHNIATGEWDTIPTLYATSGNNYDVPFDIFSAVFFLLSRYEEYYPFQPDKHNRYPATNSFLYKNGWLKRPLADEWINNLRKVLQQNFGIFTTPPTFTFQPTYDIDIAFSYLHKGRLRSLGGFLRDLVKGNFNGVIGRISVSRGKEQDPYDSFDMLSHWHSEYKYHPLFFILASLQTTDFDKNIAPSHPHMRRLIRHMAEEGKVGIHPSYYSGKYTDYWIKERDIIENITGRRVEISRQHYIKLEVPATYQWLASQAIFHDYSMGYGSHLGFRAGTGASFLFYELLEEAVSPLRVHPFCFMDTTARYEENLNCQEAFDVLKEMKNTLQICNSSLVTIFHNFSLGSDRDWTGWKKAYRDFIAR